MNTRPLLLRSALSFCTFKNGVGAKIANRRGNAKFIDIWFRIEAATFYPPAKPICIQLEGEININQMNEILSYLIFHILGFSLFFLYFCIANFVLSYIPFFICV